MGWTDKEMQEAEIIHGPDRMHSDTYRLRIEPDGEKPGKELDVSGWMVGDLEMAELRMRAAKIIRGRLSEAYHKRSKDYLL